MTDTPLARAARAIEDCMRHDASLPAQLYQDAAKRVLQALREPSEAAIAQGAYAVRGIRPASKDHAKAIWQTMIDATLDAPQ